MGVPCFLLLQPTFFEIPRLYYLLKIYIQFSPQTVLPTRFFCHLQIFLPVPWSSVSEIVAVDLLALDAHDESFEEPDLGKRSPVRLGLVDSAVISCQRNVCTFNNLRNKKRRLITSNRT